ncbi:heat shock protein, isoform CRA_b [Rattus norvegicus]|uniref:Heat shock protein, isoform CRA_b n=1 Tax=Rattus norvegicus TaxID=10116 RepID=A6KG55_RAT|nr:heat shock protein, isoform CRA_b [Rattus norvegicus]
MLGTPSAGSGLTDVQFYKCTCVSPYLFCIVH